MSPEELKDQIEERLNKDRELSSSTEHSHAMLWNINSDQVKVLIDLLEQGILLSVRIDNIEGLLIAQIKYNPDTAIDLINKK